MENKKIPIPVKLPLEAFNFGDDEYYYGIIKIYRDISNKLYPKQDTEIFFDLEKFDYTDVNNPNYYIYKSLESEFDNAVLKSETNGIEFDQTENNMIKIFCHIYFGTGYIMDFSLGASWFLRHISLILSKTLKGTPFTIEMVLSCSLFLMQIDPWLEIDDKIQKYIDLLQEKYGNSDFYRKLVNSYNAQFADSTEHDTIDSQEEAPLCMDDEYNTKNEPSIKDNEKIKACFLHEISPFIKEKLENALKMCGNTQSNLAYLEMALEEIKYTKTIAEHKTFLEALDALELKKFDDKIYKTVKTKYSKMRKNPTAKDKEKLEDYKNIFRQNN